MKGVTREFNTCPNEDRKLSALPRACPYFSGVHVLASTIVTLILCLILVLAC